MMSFWTRRQKMGWAALLMGMSVLLSRFMGLFRDKVISYLFGATQESDLYFAAFVIPDFINYLLAGGYFSITLIPLLTDYFREGEESGWQFFSCIFTWVTLAITGLTILSAVFAPRLAQIAAPGLNPEAWGRLAYFLRIILPAQICFLLGSCLMALLYLRKQFFVPALVPIIYNLAIIAGGVLLRAGGMEGFCWGVLVGAFLGNLCLPYLALRQGGDLQLRFALRHPGLKRFAVLALPLMIGQSIVVLDEQLVRIFGSLAGTGAISWLNYARRIMLVPVGIVAQAAGVASYPFLADLVARKEFQQFNRTLNITLRNTLLLLIPLSLWMIVIAKPTVLVIFQQGHFGVEDTRQTALMLRIFLAAVFCWGFQQILGRAFYAHQDTLTPALLGTVTTLASIPMFYFAAHSLQSTGVALASALSIALYSVVLSLWWGHRFSKEAFAGLGKAIFQVTALSLAAALPAVAITEYGFTGWQAHPYLAALLAIAISGLCFFLVFGLLSGVLVPSLVRPFLEKTGPLGRRFLR
jgi:putative peptidoglycan lipid II flippase